MESRVASTNERLHELVQASGLSPAVALTIFNRGLGPAAACTETTWKAYFAEPGSARFRALDGALLEHAQRQFAAVIGRQA